MVAKKLFVCLSFLCLFIVPLTASSDDSSSSYSLSPTELQNFKLDPINLSGYQPQWHMINSSAFFPTMGTSLTHGLFTKQNLYTFLIGSSLSLAVHPFDQKISNSFRGDYDTLGSTGQWVGGPVGVYSVIGGSLLM